MQSLEVISLNIWQIVVSLLNLLIMYLILKKFLFKPVQNVVAQRKAQVDKLYSDAEQARTAAQTMKQEYEASMSGARAQADSIVKEATDTARRRGDAIVNEASAEATRIKQKAEEEIAREKRQALADVRGEISGLAVEIASHIVEHEIDSKDYGDAFVDEFIGNVGEKS